VLVGTDVVAVLEFFANRALEPREALLDVAAQIGTQLGRVVERKRSEEQLREAKVEAEAATQAKSQFLASMSHELRTPLNAIIGYSEMLQEEAEDLGQDRFLPDLMKIREAGKHLLSLINDVLDLSKIEAGQLTLTVSDYSVKQIVYSVSAAVEPLLTDKKLAFKVELPPDLPAGRGDGRRITQVLLNLVSNAIKFTDEGEVTISASATGDGFTLAVRDTGPGIDPADQARIFEEFQQADNSATKRKGGSGLGLSIARRIVDMHGGRLWVESSVGSGATFFFTVPISVERQVAEA
jgi:signal transduction histidine kinase